MVGGIEVILVEIYVNGYYSFDDYIPQLMSKEMYKRINDIRDFSFVNYTNYPVSEERLSALNGFIRYRIKRLIELYNE